MTKNEHIEYWITNSELDWHRAIRCFDDNDFLFCLFCIHLSLEKVIKVIWVKDNPDNYPPKLHNLVRILEHTTINIEEKDLIFLNDLNRFQLEGRYPDYMGKIYKECTIEFTNNIIIKAKEVKACLLKNLQ
jgi:HEPN domain-containing protein